MHHAYIAGSFMQVWQVLIAPDAENEYVGNIYDSFFLMSFSKHELSLAVQLDQAQAQLRYDHNTT